MQADFPTHLKAAADATQACLAQAMRPLGDLPIAQGMRHAVTGGKGLRGWGRGRSPPCLFFGA